LLLVAGSALVLCGFKVEPLVTQLPQTLHGWLHLVGFLLAFVSWFLAFFFLAWRFYGDARWRSYSWYTLASAVVALVGFLVVPPIGFYGALAAMLLWVAIIAWRLWGVSGGI
jgi:hypothetical protein